MASVTHGRNDFFFTFAQQKARQRVHMLPRETRWW